MCYRADQCRLEVLVRRVYRGGSILRAHSTRRWVESNENNKNTTISARADSAHPSDLECKVHVQRFSWIMGRDYRSGSRREDVAIVRPIYGLEISRSDCHIGIVAPVSGVNVVTTASAGNGMIPEGGSLEVQSQHHKTKHCHTVVVLKSSSTLDWE